MLTPKLILPIAIEPQTCKRRTLITRRGCCTVRVPCRVDKNKIKEAGRDRLRRGDVIGAQGQHSLLREYDPRELNMLLAYESSFKRSGECS